MYPDNKTSLKEQYEALSQLRASYLSRAEQASKYTLPWYVKSDGIKDGTLATPYQSVGSEGVNNLASRLVMVLMPPNRPMFRLRIARHLIAQAETDPDKDKLTRINSGLSRIETEATGLIEATGDRTQLYTAILHLLIAGNVLLYVKADGTKIYSLKNYVVQRDPDGNPLLIITKEETADSVLPTKTLKAIRKQNTTQEEPSPTDPTTHEIYTSIKLKNNTWHIRQECEGIQIGTPGTYPLDKCPWIPLRLYRSEEEDYGRGYVEQYYGSLHALSVLSEAILAAAAAASKVIFLVRPSATTKIESLVRAENLSFVQGKADDIDILQIEKYNDLKTAQTQAQELTQQLSKVFLMNTAIQRNAERVTAEEIRYMAQELETALGGLYSVLAKEFQKPYITLRIKYLQQQNKLPSFAPGITPEVITGVDALGRGQDANTLIQYGQQIFKTLPPDAVMQYVNVQGYLKSLAAAYGIDDTTILKDDQQIQAEQQQAQQQQMIQQALPNVINAGGKILDTQLKGEQTNGKTEP